MCGSGEREQDREENGCGGGRAKIPLGMHEICAGCEVVSFILNVLCIATNLGKSWTFRKMEVVWQICKRILDVEYTKLGIC